MGVHVVKPGESLFSIAASFEVADWRTIYQHPQNAAFRKLRPDPARIQPGDRIFIPEAAPPPQTTKKSANVVSPFQPVQFRMAQDNTRVVRGPTPMPKLKAQPEPVAEDFTPDFAFYEYLAHDFAYLNGQAGASLGDSQLPKYLYRPVQFPKPPAPTTSPNSDSTRVVPLFVPMLRFSPEYAVSAKRPYAQNQGPMQASPLHYSIHEMPGGDPDNKTHGVYAYWLESSRGNHPIVVIRGSEFQKAPDAKADLEAGGVGLSAFKATRASFEAMLKKIGRKDIVVVGHSLGGAMAQRVTAAFANTSDKFNILQTVTFNSPGIDKKTADSLKIVKSMPVVMHYVTQGDVVSLAGETSIEGSACILEGAATARLRKLLKDGSVDKVDKVLTDLLAIVYMLRAKKYNPTQSNIGILIGAALGEWINGGADAAAKVGAELGNLHGQRLLGASGGLSKKTRVKVSSEMAKDTIYNASVEAVRKKYLGSLDLDALYRDVVERLGKLMEQLPGTIGREILLMNSPTVKLAEGLVKPLKTLRVALDELGGMSGLISKSLHIPPAKIDFNSVMQEMRRGVPVARDNTYVAPRWRPS